MIANWDSRGTPVNIFAQKTGSLKVIFKTDELLFLCDDCLVFSTNVNFTHDELDTFIFNICTNQIFAPELLTTLRDCSIIIIHFSLGFEHDIIIK